MAPDRFGATPACPTTPQTGRSGARFVKVFVMANDAQQLTAQVPAQTMRRSRSGATLVEAALVFVVFFAFIFLLVDVSWAVFAKVTLQNAVRSGVRYAVTSQTMTVNNSQLGQVASIQQTVQQKSMGLIADPNSVIVTFYAVGAGTPQVASGAGANAAGNLVIVAINAYQLRPLAPILHSSAPTSITVSAGDLIESSGVNLTPPPL